MFGLDRKNKEHEQEMNKQIARNQQLYIRVFNSEDGKEVLKDLANRSFDNITTYDPDPVKMGINEGRRSLYKYITNIVNKDIKEILEDLTKNG